MQRCDVAIHDYFVSISRAVALTSPQHKILKFLSKHSHMQLMNAILSLHLRWFKIHCLQLEEAFCIFQKCYLIASD